PSTSLLFFSFNDPPTPQIYTLSLHDALPISYVIVHDISVGDCYAPSTTWFGFLITFQYPRADVYPHFVDAQLRRADGRAHGGGLDRKSTRLNSSHSQISYAVFCLKKKKKKKK